MFCSHVPFRDAAERAGFAFAPIGAADEYAAAIANPALWHPRTSFRTLWSVIAPTLEAHFRTLASLIDGDTILIGTLWAFSARLIQALYRVPLVSVQVSPSTLLSAHAPPTRPRLTIPHCLPLAFKAGLLRVIERHVLDKVCGPALNALHVQLGLAAAARIFGQWLHSTDGVLCLFPGWFARPQPDWPEPRLLSGFPLFNDTGVPAHDPQLDAFLDTGERPVVFTAGSTLTDHARYEATVRATLKANRLRGILLNPNAEDGQHDELNLLKRRYIPMQTLLPRCRALVHHGGIGTAVLAYAAGIPQVITPFAHDQFDNAQRVAASGCGVRIDGPLQPRALSRALKQVLGSPSIATQRGRMHDRLASSPDGCEVAARYIEGLMRSGFSTPMAAPSQPFALAVSGHGT